MASNSGGNELEDVKRKIDKLEADLEKLKPENPERLPVQQQLAALRQKKVLLLQIAGAAAASAAQAAASAAQGLLDITAAAGAAPVIDPHSPVFVNVYFGKKTTVEHQLEGITDMDSLHAELRSVSHDCKLYKYTIIGDDTLPVTPLTWDAARIAAWALVLARPVEGDADAGGSEAGAAAASEKRAGRGARGGGAQKKVKPKLIYGAALDVVINFHTTAHTSFDVGSALQYLGLPVDYIVQEDDTLFKYDMLDETNMVPRTGGSVKELVSWTLLTVKYMGMAYKSINKSNNETTRRELISPFFVAAILLAGGKAGEWGEELMMRAKAEMRGFCGQGRTDYVAVYKLFYVIVTEAKKADMDKALPQVMAEIATSRYATSEARHCHKRNFDDLDVVLPMPTIAIATDGERYVFYKYTPAVVLHGKVEGRSLSQSSTLVVQTDPEAVTQDPTGQRTAAVKLLSWLVGALRDHMRAVDKVVAGQAKKAKLSTE